jgi:phosphoserine phosphatase
MEESNKKEIFERLNKCRREVDSLRAELNSLNDKKEALFKNKDVISKSIIEHIRNIKSSRKSRDDITGWVKEAKEKRRQLNDEIKTKIDEIKSVNKKKSDLISKHNIKEDPSNIKAEIEKLEYKIETECLPYKKEQELMKLIKEKRKAYESSKQISTIFESAHELSKEIDKIKSKADDIHKRIQSKAKTSQEEHEELITNSKEIDELRKKEKEAMDKFIEAKNKFIEVNDKLKAKLMEMNEIRGQIGEVKEEEKKEQQTDNRKRLSDLQRAVEEKMKKGGKLTTEDLIIMQGRD